MLRTIKWLVITAVGLFVFVMAIGSLLIWLGYGPKADPATPTLPPNERSVTRAEYGEQWPFTVDSGTLVCVEASAVLFRTDGGLYALNGRARGSRRWAEPDAILKTGELMAGEYEPVARLEETQRRAIFAASVACEDDGDRVGEAAGGSLAQQAAIARRSSDECKVGLRTARGLSESEARQIGLEGGSKGWSPLSPHRVGSINELIADGLKLCQ